MKALQHLQEEEHMDPALLVAASRYVCGGLGRAGPACEVAGFDWEDPSPAMVALRPAVSMLELTLAEVAEGLRDESEIAPCAQDLIDEATASQVK